MQVLRKGASGMGKDSEDFRRAFTWGCGVAFGVMCLVAFLFVVVPLLMTGGCLAGIAGIRTMTGAEPSAVQEETPQPERVVERLPVRQSEPLPPPIVRDSETESPRGARVPTEVPKAKPAFLIYEGMLLSAVEEELGPGRRKRRLGEAATYVWGTTGGTLEATFENDELVDWTVGGIPRGSIPSAEPQPAPRPPEGGGEEKPVRLENPVNTAPPFPPRTQPSTSVHTTFPDFTDYSVKVDSVARMTMCEVVFHSLPKTSDIAAQVMRFEVAKLVGKDGNQQIIAIAYSDEGDVLDVLPESLYGGQLVYDPVDGQTRTMDERTRVKTITHDAGAYFVKFKVEEEDKTPSIISFDRGPCIVSVVFPKRPSNSEAKTAALDTIDKLKGRDLDLSVYIFTGDKSNEMTWQKVRASSGYFLVATYDAATGEISLNEGWD